MMKVVSLRENPALLEEAIAHFQRWWGTQNNRVMYDDCMRHCIGAASPLPQWYLLVDEDGRICGGCGLAPNDFISRMDLWPWLVALYVEEDCRGHAYSALLMERAKTDTAAMGYAQLYLSTAHVGLYERYGWRHIGSGYHPWGESSRIYQIDL